LLGGKEEKREEERGIYLEDGSNGEGQGLLPNPPTSIMH